MDPATRLALDVNWRNLALGHTTFQAEGATFVVNRSFPAIYDANFIYGAAAATDVAVDRLLARARVAYAHAEAITFRIGPDAPDALTRRLGASGVERNRTLVLLLDGELTATPRPHAIRPLHGDADWAAVTEMKRTDWREHAPRQGDDPDRQEIAHGLVATNRMKCPPVRYFTAVVEGRPVGYCNVWAGIDRTGQVEDLYVEPAYRRRGIATALLHRCVAEARAEGAGPVVICADASDTPRDMYVALGWRPLAETRQYGVRVSAAG